MAQARPPPLQLPEALEGAWCPRTAWSVRC